MTHLMLIGGGLFVLLTGISIIWVIASNAGKKKERYETMEEEIEDALDTQKRRIDHSDDDSDDVRKRVRKYSRD